MSRTLHRVSIGVPAFGERAVLYAVNVVPNLVEHGNRLPEPRSGRRIRDFIVVDLASGHLSALRHLRQPGVLTVNLGTGNGSSVLDVVRTFEAVSGRTVPYEIAERRAGDFAAGYADPTFAMEAWGWKSTRSLQQMCADHWRWQLQNPTGYQGSEIPKVQESRHLRRPGLAGAPRCLKGHRTVGPSERFVARAGSKHAVQEG